MQLPRSCAGTTGLERAHDLAALHDAGEHERALELGHDLLAERQAEWPILYKMACSAAALGRDEQRWSCSCAPTSSSG